MPDALYTGDLKFTSLDCTFMYDNRAYRMVELETIALMYKQLRNKSIKGSYICRLIDDESLMASVTIDEYGHLRGLINAR